MPHATRANFMRGTGAAAAVALLPAPAHAQSTALTSVSLGATPSDDMTPILYGRKAGIFRKYGLDLQVNRMTTGQVGAQGLISGTFDFAKSSLTTILTAHEKGIPFTVVAEAFLNNAKAPSSAFVVLKDSAIQTGKDFNGALVASAGLGDIGTIALSDWVDQHGGDAKTIKFVEIPFPAVGASVEAGRVVAGVISNPNLAVALEAGKLRMIPGVFESIAPLYAEVVWVTTKDYSSKHPDVVRAFARAYNESVTYTNTHHDETVAIVADFSGIKPEVIAKMARVLAWPTVTPAHLQPVIEVSAHYGLLKTSFPATEIIDPNTH
jgi:NitT/TauT family transport system substrate-binding protein